MKSILSFFVAIKFEKVLELSVIIMRIVLLGDCSSQMIRSMHQHATTTTTATIKRWEGKLVIIIINNCNVFSKFSLFVLRLSLGHTGKWHSCENQFAPSCSCCYILMWYSRTSLIQSPKQVRFYNIPKTPHSSLRNVKSVMAFKFSRH